MHMWLAADYGKSSNISKNFLKMDLSGILHRDKLLICNNHSLKTECYEHTLNWYIGQIR